MARESFSHSKGLILFNTNKTAIATSTGWKTFPLSFMYKESYSITPNRVQDMDSTRNANGILVRNVLNHTASTITFRTPPMNNSKVYEAMKLISDNYIVANEKKLRIKYYCPQLDDYKVGDFYIPDVEFPIYKIDGDEILYNSITLEFIEY